MSYSRSRANPCRRTIVLEKSVSNRKGVAERAEAPRMTSVEQGKRNGYSEVMEREVLVSNQRLSSGCFIL